MKKYMLWILWLLLPCTTFSQHLTPRVHVLDADTVYCFSLPQSRTLAKLLLAGTYNDSLLQAQQTLIDDLEQSLLYRDSIHGLHQKTILNLEQISSNQQQQTNFLQQALESKNKQLKKSRKRQWLLGIGLGLMTAVAIIN